MKIALTPTLPSEWAREFWDPEKPDVVFSSPALRERARVRATLKRNEVHMQNPKNVNSAVHLRSVATTRRMAVSHREIAFWNTMIGKKVVMAITGIALVGFVIGHVVGILKLFAGPEPITASSRSPGVVGMPDFEYGQLLWLARIFLLIGVALHTPGAAHLKRRKIRTSQRSWPYS